MEYKFIVIHPGCYKNVEDRLAKKGDKLPSRAKSPWSTGNRLKALISPELSSSDATYFQLPIGVLQLIVEFDRLDICMDTLALESMMAMPREEYLSQVYRMFSFLESHQNTVIVFDPTPPDIDIYTFIDEDLTSSTYG